MSNTPSASNTSATSRPPTLSTSVSESLERELHSILESYSEEAQNAPAPASNVNDQALRTMTHNIDVLARFVLNQAATRAESQGPIQRIDRLEASLLRTLTHIDRNLLELKSQFHEIKNQLHDMEATMAALACRGKPPIRM